MATSARCGSDEAGPLRRQRSRAGRNDCQRRDHEHREPSRPEGHEREAAQRRPSPLSAVGPMMPGDLAQEPQTPQVPMSTSAEAIYAWFAGCSLPAWIAFSLAGNLAIFLFSVGLCGLLGSLFRDRPLFDRPQPVTRADLGLAFLAVAINTVVAVAGWLLWKAGWIRITHPAWWRTGRKRTGIM